MASDSTGTRQAEGSTLSAIPRRKIGIVAYRALPVACPELPGHFGGLETSAWLTARGLARHGELDVTLLGRHRWSLPPRKVQGVRIIARPAFLEILRESLEGQVTVGSRFPWVSIQRWDSSLLWKLPLLVMARPFRSPASDPCAPDPYFVTHPFETWCAFGVNAVSASVIASAKARSTRSLLFIQSNGDLDARYATQADFRNEYGELGSVCRFALRGADVILTQTPIQHDWLQERFGRDSVVLGNPFDLSGWEESLSAGRSLPFPLPAERYALWIGRADQTHKRPLLFLEAARACPEVPFLMILNRGDAAVRAAVLQGKPANVQIIDHVPFELMPSVFSRAGLLVFTGSREHEGLPNVLLQAAASGVPVAALDFLPESIQQAGFAIVTGTPTALVDEIRRLWGNRCLADERGASGRTYMQTQHDLDAYTSRLVKLL